MTASSMAHNVGKHHGAKAERKLRKPLIERKRRERINSCLDQLKDTVIGAFRLDQSKLEKADILEMTVKHLQNIQSSKVHDPTLGLEAQQKYSTGYIQCVHEVHNTLLTCDWMDQPLGSRLLRHLLKSLPRSADQRPPHPPTPPTPPPQASPGRDAPHRPGTPQREGPPTRHGAGRQQRPARRGSMLEMWRPW
ncbi:hairy-related 8.2 [Clinocottus analis]|uniref:hairy-related 8.2 n=1 Tax=Clinocottus analis TaxID=304258 RepID=UPI0035C1B6F6